MVRGFWWTFAQTLVRPRRAIAAIADAPSARHAMGATGLFGGLYSVAAFTSYIVGRRPRGRLLTFIPEERYYLWESMFCLPLTLVWMALFAVMVRRASARAGGTGTFEAHLTVLAFTQTAPMIVVFWLPDMTCYLLGVPEDSYLRLVPVYGSAAAAWALSLSTAGIAATERISWRRALPTVAASEIASAVGSGVAVTMR
jgi:hypothetical protein